jgi:DNA invertase Pin-like site-specific DNA recombinase
MIAQIQPGHLNQPAYVYIRQSTLKQVLHHQESTERQYALRDKARALGWPDRAIRVLDADLGVSGAQAAGREDFKLLVADVSMGKVGAVLALEASRLARSCADWHRLLELCSLTGTLIIDEDGCYDPSDFNDQLLLGLKGTMSQAELHFIRVRLQGARLNKARKGQLRFQLPVGFCYEAQDRIGLDPDEEVRGAVGLVFTSFRQTGSAYGVVRHFVEKDLAFPKRTYGGAWDGQLKWGTLTHWRVLSILRNPAYAGMYVFGRRQHHRQMGSEGDICTRTIRRDRSAWPVVLPDHHEGYISWPEYLENQTLLSQNQTNGVKTLPAGPVREGSALCQGLLLCGRCGYRLTVHYKSKARYPVYKCIRLKLEGRSTHSCLTFRGDRVDEAVARRILETLEPDQIQLAVKAFEDLDQRRRTVDHQWHMKLQRAEYEAQLAQRRYEQVDPAHRLVASTLEQQWNQTLDHLELLRKQYADYQKAELPALSVRQKTDLLALAREFPRLWLAPTTQARDRKRILRLLIKDITVEKSEEPGQILLHLRWQGGTGETISVDVGRNGNARKYICEG